MADLATAYIQLVPSLQGAQSAIEQELGGAADSAGKSGGDKLGKGFMGSFKEKLEDGGLSSAVGSMGKSVLSGAGNALAGIGKVTGKALMAGGAAAVTSVAAIGKAALDSYAEYEQLAGGVEKLYGDASDAVKANAQEAYKTSGMSANEYMSNATSFSASLIKSLDGDTAKAAELTDVAMRAISDNANTFGTDAESVSNAFQGMAKGNFMMLDNLKLGYAGTQQGMLDLINDSGVLGEKLTDTSQLADVGFGTMVEAVQAVQEQQGIAGATAKEAATTIEGSIGMTKAAWSNLLTEFGKEDGDVGARMHELVSSATTALMGATDEQGNQLSTGIMGRIQTIMAQLQTAIPTVVPMIVQALATVVPQILAVIGPAAMTLLMTVIDLITANIPNMMSAALQLFSTIGQAIATYGPTVLAAIGNMLVTLVMTIIANVPNILSAGLQLIGAIVTAIGQALPEILATAGSMLQDIWNAISSFDLTGAASDLITGLVNGITANIGKVKDAILGGIKGAVDGALSFLGIASPSKLFEWVGQMNMEGLAQGTDSSAGVAERSMSDAVRDVYAASVPMASKAPQSAAAQPVDGSAYAIMSALLGDLKNMGIYLDGNTLVGGISTRMDRALVR